LQDTQKFAEDVVSMPIIPISKSASGLTGLGMKKSLDNVLSINPKNLNARMKFQKHLNTGYWTILGFAIFFDYFIISGLLNFSELKFDLFGWIGAILFFLLGIIFTYSAISFVYYLLYLENEIRHLLKDNSHISKPLSSKTSHQ
jgi:hypothetical protein